MKHVFIIVLAAAALLGTLSYRTAFSQEANSYSLIIEDHRFKPSELQVPAGQKFKLIVDNRDPTPEEFESHALKLEKVIPGKRQATLNVGPLQPGGYDFVGEFHEKTAQGRLVAQ
ncbi:MAG TPA: cupredoxin domain-containing protein [Candidatus Competibacter sp.]|nr:cupredoxin domain-containing protein [Candidatus Competibacteraceae bacterium]HPE74145.1 cupredoxin domain-containing protein [Candidatus Competibacter sp.]